MNLLYLGNGISLDTEEIAHVKTLTDMQVQVILMDGSAIRTCNGSVITRLKEAVPHLFVSEDATTHER